METGLAERGAPTAVLESPSAEDVLREKIQGDYEACRKEIGAGHGADHYLRGIGRGTRRLWKDGAQRQWPKALWLWAKVHQLGLGVVADPRWASDCFFAAAKLGCVLSMNSLGEAFRDGCGVDRKGAAAVRWFRRAGDADLDVAWTSLGCMYAYGVAVPRNYREALAWLKLAAACREPRAMHELGILYGSGRGVERDEVEARSWHQKAADLGYVDSMRILGLMCMGGKAGPRDPQLAHDWFEKAANLGDVLSMHCLANMYESGIGVERNSDEAHKWYRVAARAGDPRAQGHLRRYGLGW